MTDPHASVTAVVLAGGGAADRVASSAGVAAKALVPLDGAPMAAYVLSALRDSGVIGRVIYVGPSDPGVRPLVDHVVPAGLRMVDSLAMGLGTGLALGEPEERLLIVTADIPWWRAEGVRGYLTEAPDVDLVYPVVAAETANAAFPQQRRTFVRLRDGRFTGGNAVLLKPGVVTALLPLMDKAFAARKAPWRLAALVGLDLVWALLTGRASFERVEARVSRLLGAQARVFVSDDAGIATDIDEPSQLEPSAREGQPLAALRGHG